MVMYIVCVCLYLGIVYVYVPTWFLLHVCVVKTCVFCLTCWQSQSWNVVGDYRRNHLMEHMHVEIEGCSGDWKGHQEVCLYMCTSSVVMGQVQNVFQWFLWQPFLTKVFQFYCCFLHGLGFLSLPACLVMHYSSISYTVKWLMESVVHYNCRNQTLYFKMNYIYIPKKTTIFNRGMNILITF